MYLSSLSQFQLTGVALNHDWTFTCFRWLHSWLGLVGLVSDDSPLVLALFWDSTWTCLNDLDLSRINHYLSWTCLELETWLGLVFKWLEPGLVLNDDVFMPPPGDSCGRRHCVFGLSIRRPILMSEVFFKRLETGLGLVLNDLRHFTALSEFFSGATAAEAHGFCSIYSVFRYFGFDLSGNIISNW